MARSARVYSLDLAGLLTSYRGFDSATIETLDASPDFQTLRLLSTLTGVDVPEIARCTLAGNHPAWLPRWTTWQHADWEITERRTLLPHRDSITQSPDHPIAQCLSLLARVAAHLPDRDSGT